MNGYESSATAAPEELAAQLDEMVRSFEVHPDEQVRGGVMMLLHRVDALHRIGLNRLVDALREAGAGEAMAHALDDASVRLLLELYDLLPGDDPAPVELALDQVRPFLATHGASVEVLGVSDGALHVRLGETAPADSATLDSLRAAIVATVREHFPALQRIRFEDGAATLPPNFIPLTLIDVRAAPVASRWHDAVDLTDLPAGSIRGVSIEAERVLLCNVEGSVYCVRDACPGSMLPLAPGILEGTDICCPWHNCRFDVRSGRRTAGTGGDLETLTVEIRNGVVALLLPPERRGGARFS